MRLGIIGKSQSGKTSLFRILAEKESSAAGGRQIGVAQVPDERVDVLNAMFEPDSLVRARVEYAEAEARKKGSNAEVPEALRTADALVAVLGLYPVTDPAGLAAAAKTELADLLMELVLSDQVLLESRQEKVQKALRVGKKAESPREPALLDKCVAALNAEQPLRALDFDVEEDRLLKGYQLLTRKPLLVVLNVAEDHVAAGEKLAHELEPGEGASALSMCAKVEAEIVALPPEERPAFLEMMGLTEPARDRLIRASYDLLGLQSFFTVGKDEVRAWTMRKGGNAIEAAGAIHSDLARGFIRAEVISYAQMLEAQTLAKARDKGWLRLEGKEYAVQDGDILNIRFSV